MTWREVEIKRAEVMACAVLLLRRMCLVVAVNMMPITALRWGGEGIDELN